MKLTTKRDRWYFWRELFSYMIPMILIVWTVDVFFNFMQCPLHPEWSAPCNVIWVNAAGYGFFLIITIIFAIFSARKLRKVKKKIEIEFMKAANHSEQVIQKEEKEDDAIKEDKIVEEVKVSKPRKVIAKIDKKSEKKEKKTIKKATKKDSDSKKVYAKKKTTKK